MKSRLLLGAAVSLAVAALAFAPFALAGDPPADGAPPSEAKITHPLMTGMVGEWQVSWTATHAGESSSGKSTAKLALGVGGTALVEDYAGPDMVPGGFYGHGVTKLSADGKTVTTWWFDTMSPEPIKLTGPITDTTSTIEGTTPMGPMKIVLTKVEGGFDFDGTLGGQNWLRQEYRKAK